MKTDLWDIVVAVAAVVVVVVVGGGGCGQMDSRQAWFFVELNLQKIIMPDRVLWQIHLGEVITSKLGLQWIDGKQSWLKVVMDPCDTCHHVLQETPPSCGLTMGLAPFLLCSQAQGQTENWLRSWVQCYHILTMGSSYILCHLAKQLIDVVVRTAREMMDNSTPTTRIFDDVFFFLGGVFLNCNCIHFCLYPRCWGGLQACTKQPKFWSIALCIFKSQSGLWHYARAWCIASKLSYLSFWVMKGVRQWNSIQVVTLGMRMRYLQWKIEIWEFWRQILPQTFVTSWILWGREANDCQGKHWMITDVTCPFLLHSYLSVWAAARDHYESLASDLEQGRPWSTKASEHPVEAETWDVIMVKSSQGQKMVTWWSFHVYCITSVMCIENMSSDFPTDHTRS